MFKKATELICKQVLLLLVKVWINVHTFITVFMQIRSFSLNLDTSIKNFETTKYSLERSFQKEYEYYFLGGIFQKSTAF